PSPTPVRPGGTPRRRRPSRPLPPPEVGRHLFLRANASRWQEEQAWDADGATLLLVRVRRAAGERQQLVGAGEPGALASALARAAADGVPPMPFGLLTRGTWDLVPADARERLGLRTGPVWDWMWSAAVPPLQPGEEHVGPVTGPAAAEEVRACLLRASPGTSADPADPDPAWSGYPGDAGGLLGLVCATRPD